MKRSILSVCFLALAAAPAVLLGLAALGPGASAQQPDAFPSRPVRVITPFPAGGSTDNIDTTYTVDLSTEVKHGTWTLRDPDAASADTGYSNIWTLTL